MNYPKVAITLLNWNRWTDTIECLESLYSITYPNYDVIVLDNGSSDDSLKMIKLYAKGKIQAKPNFMKSNSDNKPISFIEYTKDEAENGGGKEKELEGLPPSKKIILINNQKNAGVAEGFNVGMRYALKTLKAEYILMLNNDTIVSKNFLTELVKVMDSGPSIGIAGPKVYYFDFDGRRDVIHSAGGRINLRSGTAPAIANSQIDRGQCDRISEVDYLEGACMLIRSDVINKIGVLCTEYFIYWEETDFCYRAFKANYKIIYVPNSIIWHKVNDYSVSRINAYYNARNAFIFMKKFAKPSQMLSFMLYLLFFRFWKDIFLFIYRNNIKALKPYINGTMDGLKIFNS